MTRNEAISEGFLTYRATLPCPAGHMNERFVKNNECVVCRIRKVASSGVGPRPVLRLAPRSASSARKKAILAGGIAPADLDRLFRSQSGRCVYCHTQLTRGTRQCHLDHRQPVSRGGPHVIGNVQFLCSPCNLSKGAKTHVEFLLYRLRKR